MLKFIPIAQNTYRESLRSKVLYSLLLFAILLVGASIFFGSVTIGDQVKVIKDFGLFATSLFTVAYIIISGASLFHKEMSRKTLHTLLARPVTRWDFLFGKFTGLLFTASVMLILMSLGLTLLIYAFEQEVSTPLLLCYYSIFLELVIICAAVIFFSSIVVTPMLIGLFTFSLYLAGRSASLLLYLIENEFVTGFGASLCKALYTALPHLEMLSTVNEAVYNVPQTPAHLLWSSLYAFGYAFVLLFLARMAIHKREFI